MAAIAKDGLLNKLPIIVILGATGTGKSKLALQVAKKFNGEIISVDAMQVYKGLDIVTNKVTAKEQLQVPHHMIDFLGPGQPITVVDFKEKALRVMDELQSRRRLPVLAGGTYYYVEALLWRFLMDAESPEPPQKRPRLSVGDLGPLQHLLGRGDDLGADPVECLTPEDKQKLHQALQAVDPDRAAELHPNNVRKIVRSLQVVESTGRRHSDLMQEQRAEGGGNHSGPLRFRNSVILWITCNQDVLDARLDARVDQMVAQGLVDELQRFHDEHNLRRMTGKGGGTRTPAYTLGIFQSIGFKEFHEYLMLRAEAKKSKEGQRLLEEGVKLMKIATRQYARRQIKWIRRRFLCRGTEQVPPLYALDGTDIDRWDTEVRDKAFSVVGSLMDNSPCPITPELVQAPQPIDNTVIKCETCDRLIQGNEQFQRHMKSQKHARYLKRIAREANKTMTTSETSLTSSISEVIT